MATWYVRKNGNDTNAGTSPGAAFLTLTRALGASSTAAGGDTVYIGAGIYREVVTLNPSPTSLIDVVADTDGTLTGDAGEVRWTGYLNTDVGSGTGVPLNMNSKNFFRFSNFVFQSLGASLCVSNAGGHDWSFLRCAFFYIGGGGAIATPTGGSLTVDINSNILIDTCYFFGFNSSPISLTLAASATADYSVGVTIRNCKAVNGSATASFLADITGSGTATGFYGGGVLIRECTAVAMGLMRTAAGTSGVSTAVPNDVRGSLSYTAATCFIAATAGQIVEDYNILVCNTARSNVTAGVHSVAGTTIGWIPSIGHEWIYGGDQPEFLFNHVLGSAINSWGSDGTVPSTDVDNRMRPSGACRWIAAGTATSATSTTLTDSGATWRGNVFAGAVVRITGNTGAGQVKVIKSHTGTVLTVHGAWATIPDATSTYVIYYGALAESGRPTATNGNTTTVTLTGTTWATGMWSGFTCEIRSGLGAGTSAVVTGNTATALTLSAAVNVDVTSVFYLYRGTSELTVNAAAGALERHNRARKETILTDSGGACYGLDGWCDQDFQIAVDAGVTITFAVKCSFTTDHGNTNKPQLQLVANGEIGATATTVTATGTAGSGTFETLSITVTPTFKGIATFRFRSRADKPNGYASFDTVSVT